jgi:predicted nucleic acid-binding protein
MKMTDALTGVSKIFLDTAPVIYYIEGTLRYQPLTDVIFQRIQGGSLEAVTSTITLAECLVHPYRHGDMILAQKFRQVITNASNTRYLAIDVVAEQAAELRARYNLSLTDAFQIAVAILAKCEAFLTNDMMLKRVSEVTIVILDELEL